MTATPRAGTASRPSATTKGTRTLLLGGGVAGPLFTVVVGAQMAAREGFDPARHPLSLLSVGDMGWVQIANFVLAGTLFLAGAIGMRRVLDSGPAGTWGPRLIAALGVALIWGGVFVADPADSFPPGTPAGPPETLSWHGALHTLGPVVGLLAPTVACFVFARRFGRLGRQGWAAYCVTTGVVAALLAVAAFPAADYRLLFTGDVLLNLCASVVAAILLTGVPAPEEMTAPPRSRNATTP